MTQTPLMHKLNVDCIDIDSMSRAMDALGKSIFVQVYVDGVDADMCIAADVIHGYAVIRDGFDEHGVLYKRVFGNVTLYTNVLLTQEELKIVQKYCSLHDYIV